MAFWASAYSYYEQYWLDLHSQPYPGRLKRRTMLVVDGYSHALVGICFLAPTSSQICEANMNLPCLLSLVRTLKRAVNNGERGQ